MCPLPPAHMSLIRKDSWTLIFIILIQFVYLLFLWLSNKHFLTMMCSQGTRNALVFPYLRYAIFCFVVLEKRWIYSVPEYLWPCKQMFFSLYFLFFFFWVVRWINKWVLIEIINTNRNKEKLMRSLFLVSTSWTFVYMATGTRGQNIFTFFPTLRNKI
jgi:hypothetical protein